MLSKAWRNIKSRSKAKRSEHVRNIRQTSGGAVAKCAIEEVLQTVGDGVELPCVDDSEAQLFLQCSYCS